MLGILHETKLSEELWRSLPRRAALPCSIEDYFDVVAGQPRVFDSRRLYNRKPLRSIAIAQLEEELYACFTKDVSRIGVGFYAPINILPKKLVRLWLPGDNTVQLSLSRCRRRGDACFECGGLFQFSSEFPRPRLS